MTYPHGELLILAVSYHIGTLHNDKVIKIRPMFDVRNPIPSLTESRGDGWGSSTKLFIKETKYSIHILGFMAETSETTLTPISVVLLF